MNTSYNPAVDPSLNYNNTNSMNNYANDVSNLNYDTEPSTVLRPLKQYAQDNYSEDPRQFNNYNSYYHDDVGMGKLKVEIQRLLSVNVKINFVHWVNL